MTTIPDPLLDRKPWDALHGESTAAYYWFNRYRELPPDERSLPRVVSDAIDRGHSPRPRKATRGHSAPNEAPAMNSLRRWASRWKWELRALAYDQDVERRKREALESEVLEAARRHALQLRIASNVLAWPLQRFWERATDPAKREAMAAEFENMTGPQLLQLSSAISRALPAMQQAEREALGMSQQYAPSADVSEEAADDYVQEMDRMSAVLEALSEAGFTPEQFRRADA